MIADLTIRGASFGDAERLAELFQLVYRNSSHPFQSVRDIEAFLDNPLNYEMVGEVNGQIVVSMAMTHSAWNDSYELGRALTDPAFRNHGFAGLLMHRVVREVCDQEKGQVFVGYPRVRRIVELCEVLTPPMIVTGHDGGRNVANGIREMHLIVYAVPSHGKFVHVAPPEQIAQTRFVRHEVYRKLGLKGLPGQHPKAAFIGAPTSRSFEVGDFLVAYEPDSAHRAMEILAHGTPATDPLDVCGELDALFRKFPDIRHVTATVLADKIDLLRALRDYGFEVVAYRPAWYPDGECRYDCVEIAKRVYPERPLVQRFEDILDRLVEGLGSVLGPSGGGGSTRPDASSTVLRERGSEFREAPRPAIVPVAERDSLAWRPQFFRLSSEEDRFALTEHMARHGFRVRVHDTIHLQLRDLIKTQHPSVKLSSDELDSMVAEHLDHRPPEEYGVWVFYPWSGALVHLLDQQEFAELRTNRNRNKITAAEQALLATKRFGVVGLSVGQSVALTAALERSFGEIRLADFDTIDLSNLNRLRVGVHSIGVPKVYVTAREIAEIDPYLDVKVFSDGVTAANIELFLLHGGKLDVLAEECDSLDIKVLVRHEARRHGIPVVMATSDRGMVDVERFDLEPERPIFHGLAAGLDPATLRGLTNEQKIPFVLRINDVNTLSDRLRASMVEIEQSISTWPQLGADVVQGGGQVAHAIRRIALRQFGSSGRYRVDLDDVSLEYVAVAPESSRNEPVPRAAAAGHERVTDPLIRDLVSQAALAPSGGNTQPWLWRSNGKVLQLSLDPARSSAFIDVGGAASYAALGCAAENLILAAHAAKRAIRVELFPDTRSPEGCVARFTIGEDPEPAAEPHFRDELHAQIARRHTNRTMGPRRPLAPGDLDALTAAVHSIISADVQWLTSAEALAQIGDLVGVADRLRMLHPRSHHEMYRELRWTREEAEATGDGIDVATLDLAPSDMAGLELCRHWSSLELVRQWGGGRNLEKMSRKYIAAASAVGLITMASVGSRDYFQGGRALQRMWLTATERDIAVHPMTTLPYFFALVNRGGGEGLDENTITELRAMGQRYARLFNVDEAMGQVLLFRVARADATSLRSLRRPLDEVLRLSD